MEENLNQVKNRMEQISNYLSSYQEPKLKDQMIEVEVMIKEEKENEIGYKLRVSDSILLEELRDKVLDYRKMNTLKYNVCIIKMKKGKYVYESLNTYKQWTLNDYVEQFDMKEIKVCLMERKKYNVDRKAIKGEKEYTVKNNLKTELCPYRQVYIYLILSFLTALLNLPKSNITETYSLAFL